MRSTRCPQCGLTQLSLDVCRRCGAALTVPPIAPGRPLRRDASPLRDYLTISLAPRPTIRRIVDADPGRAVVLLAWLSGVSGLSMTFALGNKVDYPLAFYAALSALSGPLVGFVLVYLDGHFFTWTGRLLGGSATLEECRTAIAWSLVPEIAALPIAMAVLALRAGGPSPALLLGAYAIWAILAGWSSIVKWKCLGEVHGFSAWRAFFSSVIVRAVILALVVALALYLDAPSRNGDPPPETGKPGEVMPSQRSTGSLAPMPWLRQLEDPAARSGAVRPLRGSKGGPEHRGRHA